MASGNINSSKRNYALPTPPTASTVTTSAVTVATTVSVTPSTIGPLATGYIFTSATTGAGVTSTITTTAASSPITTAVFTNLSSSQPYTFVVRPVDETGQGPTTYTTASTVSPNLYTASTSYTAASTTTVTIPQFATLMSAIVVGGGGAGAAGAGAAGGKGGGATIFKDYAVTGGSTCQVVVGAASALSKITVGATIIAQANGGTTNVYGSGTSNVAGATNSNTGAQLVPYSLTNVSITQSHSGAGGTGGDTYAGYVANTGAAFGFGGGGQGFNSDNGGPAEGGIGAGGTGGVALFFR
jgi:hypothetical protein